VSKQVLRNVLRWGGITVAVIGFMLTRTAHTVKAFNAGRFLIWIGLVMIVSGIFVRLLKRDKQVR
jgi:uncharacterized membrane protein